MLMLALKRKAKGERLERKKAKAERKSQMANKEQEYDQEEVFEIEQGPGLPGRPGASPLDSGTPGIHTPMKALRVANEKARCAHVKPSGMRCGSPAMRDIEFCYYHKRTHIGPRLLYPTMTMLEDGHGVQAALMEVLCAIMDGVLSDRQAALMLYGLQTAASNLKRVEQVDPREVAIEPAPEEKLPEGVFERKRDQWSPEEKIAIEKFMQEMTVKKAWRQSEEERRSG
jgi:hypothetical protein